jgi:hypothetical protein
MPRTIVLVTRIAITWAGKVPDSNWLDSRLDMLHTVGIPAFARIRSDVTWVWRTAPEHRSRLTREARIDDRIVVVDEHDKDARRIPGHEFLVARVDSDDAWLPAAFDELTAVSVPHPAIVDYQDGWQLKWSTGQVAEATYRGRWQGPFLAVTQDRRDRMLDTGGQHTTAHIGRRRIRPETRGWLQIIHSANIANEWRGIPVRHPRHVLDQFGVRLAGKRATSEP